MNLMRTTKPRLNRRALATTAMQAAIAVRAKAKLDQTGPICIYALCETLGVVVRFNKINMEGMYQRGTQPRIHLSSRRPLPRRAYNCAHELGHHVFGHGSAIDELREHADIESWEDPKEFLADTFAGFVLMPTIGLRRAFAVRGWAPDTATATQIFMIACDFGVGYTTLLTHLSSGLNMITLGRATALKRFKLNTLREDILGVLSVEPLVIADRYSASPTIDVEVKTQLLLPAGTEVANGCLVHERDIADGRLFRAMQPGIVQAHADAGSWAAFIRVAPEEYVGLAQYRHLEDDPDE